MGPRNSAELYGRGSRVMAGPLSSKYLVHLAPSACDAAFIFPAHEAEDVETAKALATGVLREMSGR